MDSQDNREELIVMPLNKEFSEKLAENKNKYKLEKDGTLILKSKLVMREGTHNDVNYSWDELKASYLTGEGAGLFYDHDDSVKNHVIPVDKNSEGEEGVECPKCHFTWYKYYIGDLRVGELPIAIIAHSGYLCRVCRHEWER